MAIINSGYITNDGLNVLYGLINNKSAFDLDIFKFGIGNKEDYVYFDVDLSERTFAYDGGTFTLESGDTLPDINLTTYPYILIGNDTYEVSSYTNTTIKIVGTYGGGSGNITIESAVSSNDVNGKFPESDKISRSNPAIADTLYNGTIDGIERIDETTIEIKCIIPEDRTRTEEIFFDEVYLYGANEDQEFDVQYKLLFVSEMTFGGGVYTGFENNIFSIQIKLSNVADATTVNYNIDNLTVKKDVEAIELAFLYILSKKNEDIREYDARMSSIEDQFGLWLDTDETFADYVYERLKQYVYDQVNLKYEVTEIPLVQFDINLLDSINLGNYNLSSTLPDEVSNDILRVVGIVPQSVMNTAGDVYIAGFDDGPILFYRSNGNLASHDENELVAFMTEENATDVYDNFALFKTEFSNLIIDEDQELNVYVLKDLLDDGDHPYSESSV